MIVYVVLFCGLALTLNMRREKVAWETITTLKSEGGLGLRPLKEINITCCLKLIWRITSAQSLWVRWVKTYLLKGETFWSVKNTTTLGSWMWQKLLKYRDKAKEFHRVEVKNGQASSFWRDAWSEMGRLFDLIGARDVLTWGFF